MLLGGLGLLDLLCRVGSIWHGTVWVKALLLLFSQLLLVQGCSQACRLLLLLTGLLSVPEALLPQPACRKCRLCRPGISTEEDFT